MRGNENINMSKEREKEIERDKNNIHQRLIGMFYDLLFYMIQREVITVFVKSLFHF